MSNFEKLSQNREKKFICDDKKILGSHHEKNFFKFVTIIFKNFIKNYFWK